MAYKTTLAQSCKGARDVTNTDNDLSPTASHDPQQITFNVPYILAIFAAILFAGSSIAIGASYGHMLGSQHSALLGYVFATVAVAAETIKPVAFAAVFAPLGCWAIGRRSIAGVLGVACLAFSFTADLGLSSMVRGDLAESRNSDAKAGKDDADKRARAARELSNAAPARPTAEIAGMVKAIDARIPQGTDCSSWVASKAVRDRCVDRATLEAEAGRAQRRAELEAILVAPVKPAASSVKDADPLASSLVVYAAATGLIWDAEQVSRFTALILPVVLALGSSCSLVLVGVFRPVPRQQRRASSEVSGGTDGTLHGTPAAQGKVIDLLKAQGGQLASGQRALADRLGMSLTHLNRTLGELAEAGAVMVETRNTGTVLRLAAAA